MIPADGQCPENCTTGTGSDTAPEDRNHFLTITTNATYWGDSIGAMTALRLLTSRGYATDVP